MKLKTICLLLICLPLLAFSQSKWQAIDKLEGTWQVKGKVQFESWKKLAEYELEGVGYEQKGEKQRAVRERLLISGHPKGAIYFEATVPDQNDGKTIPFVLTKSDRRNLVFENPKHDFPQKIHYQFRGKRKLKVHVSAGEKGFVLTMNRI
jgi:hypothetical protein